MSGISAFIPESVISNTLGASLIGSMVSSVLYGLTLYQALRYYGLYPKDITFHRIIVPTLLVLETVHTICTLQGCYYYTVTNFFNPAALLVFHITLKLTIPLTGVTTVICQGFYARRVYLFGSHHRWSVAVAALFVLAKMAFCILATVKVFQSPFVTTLEQDSWMISASYGCTIVVDSLLTGTLIYVLLRSRTGFKRTDDMVDTLVLYTLNTGLVTSIVGAIVFVLALAKPYNLVWASVSFVSNKLYANAVLAVLNSRLSLSSRMFESEIEMQTIGAQLRWRMSAEPSSPQIAVPLPITSRRLRASAAGESIPAPSSGSRLSSGRSSSTAADSTARSKARTTPVNAV